MNDNENGIVREKTPSVIRFWKAKEEWLNNGNDNVPFLDGFNFNWLYCRDVS